MIGLSKRRVLIAVHQGNGKARAAYMYEMIFPDSPGLKKRDRVPPMGFYPPNNLVLNTDHKKSIYGWTKRKPVIKFDKY